MRYEPRDFEKDVMKARLELAERQLLDAIERNDKGRKSKVLDIELHLILSTVTGKENKWIEF